MSHDEWDNLLRLRNDVKYSVFLIGTIFNQISGDLEDLEEIIKRHKPKKDFRTLKQSLESSELTPLKSTQIDNEEPESNSSESKNLEPQ